MAWLLAGAWLVLAAGPVAARCVAAEFEGVVTASFDLAGTAGHGRGFGVLDGRAITGTLAFDVTLAPPAMEVSPAVVVYATRNGAARWMPLVRMNLGGRALAVPAFEGAITTRDVDRQVKVWTFGGVSVARDLDYGDAATGEFLDYAVSLWLLPRGGEPTPGSADDPPAETALAATGTGRGSASVMYQSPHGPMRVNVGLDFEVHAVHPLDPARLADGCDG